MSRCIIVALVLVSLMIGGGAAAQGEPGSTPPPESDEGASTESAAPDEKQPAETADATADVSGTAGEETPSGEETESADDATEQTPQQDTPSPSDPVREGEEGGGPPVPAEESPTSEDDDDSMSDEFWGGSPESEDPFAEDSSDEGSDEMWQLSLVDLMDMEITTASGGIAESASTTAATVVLITKDDIRKNGWRSMTEILSNVPGIYVVDNLVTPALSVRGVNGGLRAGTRIVKIMINGVAVNFRPDLTAFIGPEFLPMEVIEQIEVVKGPLSALYGANAFLATVNVITKKPKKGFDADVAGRGTWQQSSSKPGWGGSAATMFGSEHFDGIVAASYDRIDRSGLEIDRTFAQQSAPDTELELPFLDKETKRDRAKPVSAYIKLDGKVTEKTTISAQAGLQKLDSSAEFDIVEPHAVLSHQNRIQIYNFWSSLSHTQQWTKAFSSEVSAGVSTGKPASDTQLVDETYEGYYRKPMYKYTALNLAGHVRLDVDWLNIKIGGDFENNWEDALWYKQIPFSTAPPSEIEPPDYADYVIRSAGVYTAIVSHPLYKWVPDLKVSGNIRLDHLGYGETTLPSQLSWRLAATYNKGKDWAVKVFGGKSFQGPSGVLMFAEPRGFRGFDGNNIMGQMIEVMRQEEMGWDPDDPLSPQVATSIEGAGSVRLFDILNIEGGVYFQKIDDVIRFEQFNLDYQAVNTGESKFVGTDWTVRGVFFKRLAPSASVSYLHPLDAEEDEIELFPRLQVLGSVGLPIPEIKLHLNVLGRYISERGATSINISQSNANMHYSLDAYGDLDVTLSTMELHLFNDEFETIITASGRNLIAKKSSEPGFSAFDYPRIGRSFFLELRQTF